MGFELPTGIRPGRRSTSRRTPKIPGALTRIAQVLIVGAALVYLAGRFGHLHWLADLCAHFVTHMAALTFGCTIILVLAKKPRWSIGAAVLLVTELLVLAPYLVGGDLRAEAPKQGHRIRILQFNISEPNSNWPKFFDWLHPRVDAFDVIVFLEYAPSWHLAVGKLEEKYPAHLEVARMDSSGIAVYSRLPGSRLVLRHLGPSRMPAVELRARLGEQALTLIAAHTNPPLGERQSELRNVQLDELAEWIVNAPPGHKILLGDLNVTPFSPWFSHLREASALADAQVGLGLLPTWVPGPVPTSIGLPIDHTLISNGLSVLSRACGERFGSDHCPVTTELRIVR